VYVSVYVSMYMSVCLWYSVSQVKVMFSEFDKDNSGSISINEAQTMFSRLGLQEKDVEELVAKYDVDNDGELQYFEFVALLMNVI